MSLLPAVPENLENIPVVREYLASLVAALVAEGTPVDLDFLIANFINKDGSLAFTGDESMGGHRLTDVSTPLVGTDAANKDYVDGIASGGSAGGGGNHPIPPLAIVNQPSGSYSTSSGSPTPLPSSGFTFMLTQTSTVAVDVFVLSEQGFTAFDNEVEFTASLKNLNTLVSTPIWQSLQGVQANGTPSANGQSGYTGIKRSLLTLPAGTYNYQLTGFVAGGGTFAISYPLSIVVTLLG